MICNLRARFKIRGAERFCVTVIKMDCIPLISNQPVAYIVKIMSSRVSFLKDYIEQRAIEIANYMITTNATVRQTAKKYGVSKSTVHKDITDRLQQLNPSLAAQARQVLNINKAERHIRGGLATKEKYLHLERR